MTEEKYYSIDEVAKILKVAYLTVYRWIRAKQLPSLKAGKQYRVASKDLDIFLNSYKYDKNKKNR